MECCLDKPVFSACPGDSDYAVASCGRLILVCGDGQLPTVSRCREAGAKTGGAVLAAHCGGRTFWGLDWWPDEVPEGFKAIPARAFFCVSNAGIIQAVTRAVELVTWRLEHRYCGRCGGIMELNGENGALRCLRCHFESFPLLSPAMIVRITDGGRILLGRSSHFRTRCFSNFSGFVESGENFEECVHREVKEELGIQVRNVRYFGSQNWPFPHSLLAAFAAEYAAGEVAPDGEEIIEARWFQRDEPLPLLPEPGSISRALIDDFINGG